MRAPLAVPLPLQMPGEQHPRAEDALEIVEQPVRRVTLAGVMKHHLVGGGPALVHGRLDAHARLPHEQLGGGEERG